MWDLVNLKDEALMKEREQVRLKEHALRAAAEECKRAVKQAADSAVDALGTDPHPAGNVPALLSHLIKTHGRDLKR